MSLIKICTQWFQKLLSKCSSFCWQSIEMFCLVTLIFYPLLLISNTLKSLNCLELQKLSGILKKYISFCFSPQNLTSVLGMLYLPSSKWPTLFVSEVFVFLGAVTSTLFFPLILLGGLHIVLINQHIHWVAAVCLALSWVLNALGNKWVSRKRSF